MRALYFMTTLALIPSVLWAQPAVTEVDQAEVLRRGNLVELVGDESRASQTESFPQAMAPPASDADKWFISVISMRSCPGCEKLKHDWATSPWLLALAQPGDTKQSWAHYGVYDKDDRSQAFRFERLKITTFPTILVQPPRSKRYGDPSSVVYQGVYKGDPETLAREILQSIARYLQKLSATPSPVRLAFGQKEMAADAPWQPVPKVDPWQPAPTPNPQLPTLDPIIPPQPALPAPAQTFPWSSLVALLMAGFSLPAMATLIVWAIYVIRARRQVAGKAPLVDQATLDRILQVLQKLAEQPQQLR